MSPALRLPARIVLGYLALSGALVGLWAGLAPRSFYDDFPGLGRVWVAVDGPYNEHLVRDVGWLNLALMVATIWAAVTLARALVVGVLAAWLVTGVPHLVYHVANLGGLGTGDRFGELASLALAPVLAGVLLVLVALDGRTATGGRRWADGRGSPSSGGR
jgi:hypothetical protein